MKNLLLASLRFYKNFLSPFTHRLFGLQGMVCRHSPTCSQYTYQMIEKYGVLKGGLLGAKRLASCHPYKKSVSLNLN